MTRHRVNLAEIDALPNGRRKGILARKALAAHLKLTTTRALRARKITTAKAIAAMADLARTVRVVTFTVEPRDPTDLTQAPALLAELAIADAASDAALLRLPSARREVSLTRDRKGIGRRWFSRDLPLDPFPETPRRPIFAC